MATRQDERMVEPDMNPQELWLEEVFTDRRVGTIRRLTPVDGSGARDPGREILFIGETQVMSQMGALPINFALEAKSLGEAATMFGPAAKAGIERTVKELQELRRQQASSIVVAQGGMPPMGMGGGKIQMP